VDIRIGVTDNPREIVLVLADDAGRDDVKAAIEAALAGESSSLWLTDDKGREVGVVAAKIAFVEIGPDDTSPIGFG
jgi:hypothetical protein